MKVTMKPIILYAKKKILCVWAFLESGSRRIRRSKVILSFTVSLRPTWATFMKLCRKKEEGWREERREGGKEKVGTTLPPSLIIRSQINYSPVCSSPSDSTLSQEFLPNPQDGKGFEELAASFSQRTAYNGRDILGK